MKNLKILATAIITALAITFMHCAESDQSTKGNDNGISNYSEGNQAPADTNGYNNRKTNVNTGTSTKGDTVERTNLDSVRMGADYHH